MGYGLFALVMRSRFTWDRTLAIAVKYLVFVFFYGKLGFRYFQFAAMIMCLALKTKIQLCIVF